MSLLDISAIDNFNIFPTTTLIQIFYHLFTTGVNPEVTLEDRQCMSISIWGSNGEHLFCICLRYALWIRKHWINKSHLLKEKAGLLLFRSLKRWNKPELRQSCKACWTSSKQTRPIRVHLGTWKRAPCVFVPCRGDHYILFLHKGVYCRHSSQVVKTPSGLFSTCLQLEFWSQAGNKGSWRQFCAYSPMILGSLPLVVLISRSNLHFLLS